MSWTAERITADAAEKMQIGAGILLNSFDISNPVEPADSAIICDTTGDFTITCTAETSDIFEDVNNAPTNTKEGKRIDGWTCGLSVESLTFTEEALKFALGAADVSEDDGGVHPRKQYKAADFASLYWVGDMLGSEDQILVVAMDNAVSTGGISITTTNRGKGRMALDITPHVSTANQDKMPMAFYVLTKEPSTHNVDLASLEVGNVTFDRPFDPNVTRYVGEAYEETGNIYVTTKNENATVNIESEDATIGVNNTASWREGANYVTITVTDGMDEKVYELIVIYQG